MLTFFISWRANSSRVSSPLTRPRRPSAEAEDRLHQPKMGMDSASTSSRTAERSLLLARSQKHSRRCRRAAIFDGSYAWLIPGSRSRRMAQMRTRSPVEDQLNAPRFGFAPPGRCRRQRNLARLCRRSHRLPAPGRDVPRSGDPIRLLQHVRVRGVVSKRNSARYASGPSRHRVKSEVCPLDAHERRALAGVRGNSSPSRRRTRKRGTKKTAELMRLSDCSIPICAKVSPANCASAPPAWSAR